MVLPKCENHSILHNFILYFSRVVAMSGNAMCDQFHQSDPQAAAAELGSALGCTSKKGEDIVECVKRFRQQEIVRASKEMTVSTAGGNHMAFFMAFYFTAFLGSEVC